MGPKIKIALIICLICLLSMVMHLRIFNKDLIGYHVWRQTETQTVINNYIKTTTPFIKPLINDLSERGDGLHIREFPMMQWTFAQLSMNVANPYITSRILSFLISCLSLFGIYYLVKLIFSSSPIAILSTWLLCFSPVFYYYCVNPMPDNLALCFGIFSIFYSVNWYKRQKISDLILALLFLSLATLIKLPFVLNGCTLFYFLLVGSRNNTFKLNLIKIGLCLFFLSIPLIWYFYSINTWGGKGLQNGVFGSKLSVYDSLDIIVFNLVSTLPELFVNYVAFPVFCLGIFYFLKNKRLGIIAQGFIFQLIFLTVYFLYEHNMIGKVHDYYLLPFIPIIILTSCYGFKQLLTFKNKIFKYSLIIGIILMPLTAYLRIQNRWDENKPGFNKAFYDYKSKIRKILPKNARCIIGNDPSKFILLYYIDRKGWTFDLTNLNHSNFKLWMEKGATHVIFDSNLETIPEISKHFGAKLFDQDGIKIYLLLTPNPIE